MLAIVVSVVVSLYTVTAGFYLGVTFLHQSIFGGIYGFIYLVFMLHFDENIHSLCLQTGFLIKSSRKWTFYMLFLSIGLFIFASLYYCVKVTSWLVPYQWTTNAANEQQCGADFKSQSMT